MGYCSNCGNEYSEYTINCIECGEEIGDLHIDAKTERIIKKAHSLPIILLILLSFTVFIQARATVIENKEKDEVLNYAIMVENLTKLYCSGTSCEDGATLTWDQLFNENWFPDYEVEYYDTSYNNGAISTWYRGEAGSRSIDYVDLEVLGTGSWELTQGVMPPKVTRNSVIIDID